MNVTTKDLRSNVYGTPCGHSDICGTSLTHELVIEFIDIFFGGVLENVETGDDEETGGISIYGGEPILKKLTITNNEFDYFTLTISKKFKSGLISDISDYLDIPTD